MKWMLHAGDTSGAWVTERELLEQLRVLGWPAHLYGPASQRDERQRDRVRQLRVACGAGWGTSRMLQVEAGRRRDSEDRPRLGSRGADRELSHVTVDSAAGGRIVVEPINIRDELNV